MVFERLVAKHSTRYSSKYWRISKHSESSVALFVQIKGSKATSFLFKGKKKEKKKFLFDLCSATPPIADLTLRVRPRVGFYHLAAGLICATALW